MSFVTQWGRNLTQNQLSDVDVVQWIWSRLADDPEEVERSTCARDQLLELGLTMMDVFCALKAPADIGRDYLGGCFVVTGCDLDGHSLTVVVAPPSEKNRLRIVKVWRGK